MKLDLQGYVQDILHKKIETYHIVVRQHDEEVGRFDFRKDNRRDNIHSVTKAFPAWQMDCSREVVCSSSPKVTLNER